MYEIGATDRIVNALLMIERQLRRIADSMGASEVPMPVDEVKARQERELDEWIAGQAREPFSQEKLVGGGYDLDGP